MTKKYLKDLAEYRKWAFELVEKTEESTVEEAVGLIIEHDCWEYNEDNEPVDEHGNVLVDPTPETVKLADWVNELVFPLIAIYWIENTSDRLGKMQITAVDFVEQREFEAYGNKS